jgi:hypothetical protein
MSEAKNEPPYTEHKSIFLEPCCADCEEEKCGSDDGRQWSEDNPGTCDNCEEKAVRFVRADLVAETKRQRHALLEACKLLLPIAWQVTHTKHRDSIAALILECDATDA